MGRTYFGRNFPGFEGVIGGKSSQLDGDSFAALRILHQIVLLR